MYYTFDGSGNRLGPFSPQDLQKFMADGRLNRDAEVEDASSGARMRAIDAAGAPLPPVQSAIPPRAAYAEYEERAPQLKRSNATAWIIAIIIAIPVLGCGCFGAILAPVFSQAQSQAKKTQAMAETKLLYGAALVYASDYDDHLPPIASGEALELALIPYTMNTWTKDLLADGHAAMNPNLVGKTTKELEAMEDTIAFWRNRPTEGYAVIALTNGSCRAVNKSRLERQIARGDYSATRLTADSKK